MKDFILPIEFSVDDFVAYADGILTDNYKSEQIQKKVRSYLTHLEDALRKKAAGNTGALPTETLFSLDPEEIETMLRRRETKNDMVKHTIEGLASRGTAEEKVAFLRESNDRMELVFNTASFYEFDVQKIEANDSWKWRVKVLVKYPLKKTHYQYTAHFVLSPEQHFDRMRDLEEEIKDIKSKPQMSLVPEEENERIQQLRQRQEDEKARWEEQQKLCIDLKVEITTKKNEWKEVKVKDENGEDDWIDGSVMEFFVPAYIINQLNDLRMNLGEYAVRLSPR